MLIIHGGRQRSTFKFCNEMLRNIDMIINSAKNGSALVIYFNMISPQLQSILLERLPI